MNCNTKLHKEAVNSEQVDPWRGRHEGLALDSAANGQLITARSEIDHLIRLLEYRSEALIEANRTIEELYEEVSQLKGRTRIEPAERNWESQTSHFYEENP